MKNTKQTGNTNPVTEPSSDPTGLGNPVAVAAIATQIPWGFLIRAGLIAVGVVYVVNKFKNRFIKWDEIDNYPPANISEGQAESRADVIHAAMKGLGDGFDVVRENIAGLNYNGWARLYNAFGNREDAIPNLNPFAADMNLVEWFEDQFSDDELGELRVLVPNTF